MTRLNPISCLAPALLGGFALAVAAGPARADRLENQVAVFSALDKVTATIKKLEIPLNETVQYGALKVTPRVCYSRPQTEEPKTTSFVEVDEIQVDGKEKRLFTGWMFAQSPGLNAVEHPVFDVWLTDCQKPTKTVVQRPAAPATDAQGGSAPVTAMPPEDDGSDFQHRRVRR